MSFNIQVSVGGTIVRIKPSKSNSAEVHVSNLNPHVDEVKGVTTCLYFA
jgi:hypothetical protein